MIPLLALPMLACSEIRTLDTLERAMTQDVKIVATDGSGDAYLGQGVSAAGDVNADGYGDVVVAAPLDSSRRENAGSAYIYLGGPHGADLSTEVKLEATDWGPDAFFGYSPSRAGDVNGDGYGDVVVGAMGDNDHGPGAGAVYVFLGSAAGIDPGSESKLIAADVAPEDNFGRSVSSAGDVNGDGYDDVVVGAHGDDDNGSASGSMYVYLGSGAGIDPAAVDKISPTDGEENEQFGISVAGVGDVNGDGYDDVVAGAFWDDEAASYAGSIYLYLGSAAGIDPGSETKVTADGGMSGANFGWSVAGAGDVDGDGYDDVIVGANYDNEAATDAGAAYVFHGCDVGLELLTETKLMASDAATEDELGYSVAGAGDVNDDGYDDVIVGAYTDDDNGSGSGSAYVYMGSATGVDLGSEVKLVSLDGDEWDYFGVSVSGAGDTNADGADDVIVGAMGDDDAGYSSGSAYTFLGTCTEQNWYADFDEDGFGDPDATWFDCLPPNGYIADASDCDDTDATVNPAAEEVCDDGLDNDCNDLADEDDPACGSGDDDDDSAGDDDTADDDTSDDDTSDDDIADDDIADDDDDDAEGSACDCRMDGRATPATAVLMLLGVGAILARRRL